MRRSRCACANDRRILSCNVAYTPNGHLPKRGGYCVLNSALDVLTHTTGASSWSLWGQERLWEWTGARCSLGHMRCSDVSSIYRSTVSTGGSPTEI